MALVPNVWGSNVISTFAYTYAPVARRTARIDDGLTTNLFAYNLRSELTSAHMSTNLYAYTYDPIGNRLSATENGATTLYAANELNQYTNALAGGRAPTYDLDGNMTSDGTWSYTWDAENRLIEVQPLVTNLDSTLVQYMYDAQSRRIARREFAWMAFLHDDPAWRYVQGRAYRYDDWNLLQERKPAIVPRTPHPYISQTDLALTGIGGPVSAAYVWGLDLSGTLQGAGGIGGLLMQHHSDTNSSWVSFCDANGNITDLLDEDGSSSAHYEYDSHGNTTSMLCEQGDTNPFRFSSKYHDDETGLYYYGFRFYSSQMGRWLNRDPILEKGGRNIYGHTANNPMNKVDILGLTSANEQRNYKDCIQAKQNMENGMTTGNQWLDYYATEMKRRGCKYKIECHLCSRGLKPPMGSPGDARQGPFYPTIGTCVARIAIDGGGTLETLVHEMTHCVQACMDVRDCGCKGCLCKEIQAYYRENPSMQNSDLLRQAIRSCSGYGYACEKVELKNVRAMMKEEEINECKGLFSPH